MVTTHETEARKVICELMRKSTIRMISSIQEISVKEKRKLFSLLRKNAHQVNENWIFPFSGISVGELCVAQVLDQDTNTNTNNGQSTKDNCNKTSRSKKTETKKHGSENQMNNKMSFAKLKSKKRPRMAS